jgi:hypothetical protein
MKRCLSKEDEATCVPNVPPYTYGIHVEENKRCCPKEGYAKKRRALMIHAKRVGQKYSLSKREVTSISTI